MPQFCSLEWCDRPHYALGYLFSSQCAALQGGGEGTPRREAWP
jgi:hypothetical protein